MKPLCVTRKTAHYKPLSAIRISQFEDVYDIYELRGDHFVAEA